MFIFPLHELSLAFYLAYNSTIFFPIISLGRKIYGCIYIITNIVCMIRMVLVQYQNNNT